MLSPGDSRTLQYFLIKPEASKGPVIEARGLMTCLNRSAFARYTVRIIQSLFQLERVDVKVASDGYQRCTSLCSLIRR